MVEISTVVQVCAVIYLLFSVYYSIVFFKDVESFVGEDIENGGITNEDKDWVIRNKWWLSVIFGLVYPMVDLIKSCVSFKRKEGGKGD